MSALEILKLVAEGGSMVLLAAVLYGIFKLADKYAPQFIAAWNGITAALAANTTKLDQVLAAANETRSRASEASEGVAEIRGATLGTGQYPAVTTDRPPLPSDPTRRRPT